MPESWLDLEVCPTPVACIAGPVWAEQSVYWPELEWRQRCSAASALQWSSQLQRQVLPTELSSFVSTLFCVCYDDVDTLVIDSNCVETMQAL